MTAHHSLEKSAIGLEITTMENRPRNILRSKSSTNLHAHKRNDGKDKGMRGAAPRVLQQQQQKKKKEKLRQRPFRGWSPCARQTSHRNAFLCFSFAAAFSWLRRLQPTAAARAPKIHLMLQAGSGDECLAVLEPGQVESRAAFPCQEICSLVQIARESLSILHRLLLQRILTHTVTLLPWKRRRALYVG